VNEKLTTDVELIKKDIDFYNREIKRLDELVNETIVTLKSIQTELSQIKWFVVGASIVVMAETLGVGHAIKAIL